MTPVWQWFTWWWREFFNDIRTWRYFGRQGWRGGRDGEDEGMRDEQGLSRFSTGRFSLLLAGKREDQESQTDRGNMWEFSTVTLSAQFALHSSSSLPVGCHAPPRRDDSLLHWPIHHPESKFWRYRGSCFAGRHEKILLWYCHLRLGPAQYPAGPSLFPVLKFPYYTRQPQFLESFITHCGRLLVVCFLHFPTSFPHSIRPSSFSKAAVSCLEQTRPWTWLNQDHLLQRAKAVVTMR